VHGGSIAGKRRYRSWVPDCRCWQTGCCWHGLTDLDIGPGSAADREGDRMVGPCSTRYKDTVKRSSKCYRTESVSFLELSTEADGVRTGVWSARVNQNKCDDLLQLQLKAIAGQGKGGRSWRVEDESGR
jgi:hypothetical protein